VHDILADMAFAASLRTDGATQRSRDQTSSIARPGSRRTSPTAARKRALLAVDEAVIERQAERHDLAQRDLTLVLPRTAAHRADAEDSASGGFRMGCRRRPRTSRSS
jgi:hypothetical protein